MHFTTLNYMQFAGSVQYYNLTLIDYSHPLLEMCKRRYRMNGRLKG